MPPIIPTGEYRFHSKGETIIKGETVYLFEVINWFECIEVF